MFHKYVFLSGKIKNGSRNSTLETDKNNTKILLYKHISKPNRLRNELTSKVVTKYITYKILLKKIKEETVF